MISQASRAWLEILSVEGIGPRRWLRASEALGLERVRALLESPAGRAELARYIGRDPGEPDRAFYEEQHARIERGDCSVVSISDASYPSLLRELAAPPTLLYYRGHVAVADRPAITVVGSRSASRRGFLIARRLAFELARREIVVVSGMARGIDAAAHQGALEAGGGTCAVLGCGVDVVYPPEHGALAEAIEERGCILSELPLGSPPLRHHFPRRNRIMSGLALGVLVVEADMKSGAMVTARWAAEQNREVFAVPGPIEHPGSRGPHRLIREGAALVEGVEDILAELPPCGIVVSSTASTRPDLIAGLPDAARRVLASLGLDPKHIDDLVGICHSSATSILPVLLDLEMKGLIVPTGGGCYALASPAHEDIPGGS